MADVQVENAVLPVEEEVRLKRETSEAMIKSTTVRSALCIVTAERRAVHADLRARTEALDLTPEERCWLTDACLYRYLRAREYKIDKSDKMLQASIEWRRESGADLLKIDDMQDMLESGKLYTRGGRDKHGRPIVYMRPGRENLLDQKRNCDFLTYNLMSAIELMDEAPSDTGAPVETWVMLCDYAGMNWRQNDIKTNMAVLSIMLDHFPERLGTICLINPPRVFWMFWSMVKPFLNDVTLGKVTFIETNPVWKRRQSRAYKPKATDEPAPPFPDLLKFIDESELEEDMGGSIPVEFDAQVLLPMYKRLDAKRAARLAAARDAAPMQAAPEA